MSLIVNYHGFFDGSFGIAEATRLNVLALEGKGVIVNKINYNTHEYVRITNTIPNIDINIYHININIVADFFANNRDLKLQDKYNILYWAWEFPEVSQEKINILNSFDELWVPSDFCVNIFTKYTNTRVLKVPHPIQILEKTDVFDLEQYKIPIHKKKCVTIFDSLSTTIRKNPEATIKAFLKAIESTNDAVLIVKTYNVEKSNDAKKIIEKYSNNPNIIIITELFSKEKLHSMIQQCDILISLHGSEGFGLTMAEAMGYGKIVIATGYSGNLDFMNVNNSFLIKYDFIKTYNTKGLLEEGLTIAKPDIEDASDKLKYVITNYSNLEVLQEKAKYEITKNFSLENIGDILQQRLKHIAPKGEKSKQNTDNSEVVFYMAEIKILKNRINYLERTIYNKIRKKVNLFFKKLRGKN